MTTRYEFETPKGLFALQRRADGMWVTMFESEALEPHITPEKAAHALASGEGVWPSCGDPSVLGIPDELSGWRRVRSR